MIIKFTIKGALRAAVGSPECPLESDYHYW